MYRYIYTCTHELREAWYGIGTCKGHRLKIDVFEPFLKANFLWRVACWGQRAASQQHVYDIMSTRDARVFL